MNPIVILPTYNERDNLEAVVTAIRSQPSDLSVLIVDDNSPDGTGEIGDEMARRFAGKVSVLHRERKEGLGRAYVAAFRKVLTETDHDVIIHMDADLSHDPAALAGFLAAIEAADLVLGSRYLTGISVVNWDFKRLILSKCASFFVRTVTGMPFSDPTGGYKCWRRSALALLPLDEVASRGYVFLVETTFQAFRSGMRIQEIPIVFHERNLGRSKISLPIIAEAFWRVLLLRFTVRR